MKLVNFLNILEVRVFYYFWFKLLDGKPMNNVSIIDHQDNVLLEKHHHLTLVVFKLNKIKLN